MDFSSKSISSFLSSTGSKTRGSLISSAELIAQGITKSGDLIKTHTSECESQSDLKILPHIQNASSATSNILNTTHDYLGIALNKTLEVAEKQLDSGSKSENETVKKIMQNEGVQATLQIGKATAFAGLDILGGVSEGLSIIKGSGIDTTSGVVQHKFGEDAGKATREGFNIAGNVAGMYALVDIGKVAGVSADGVMKIRDEATKLQIIFSTLTKITI